jgi:hypothetical protein
MKKLILLLSISLSSCSSQEVKLVETTQLRVNHYKKPAMGLSPTLVYLVQEFDKIGTNSWSNFYSEIEGFHYELGYVYTLDIKKEIIEYPPQDASSIKYSLISEVSKTKVADKVAFQIQLKSASSNKQSSYVIKKTNGDYAILNEINFSCSELCERLENVLKDKNEVTGVFIHTNTGKLKLINLITD